MVCIGLLVKLYGPVLWMGLTASWLEPRRGAYLLPLSSQKFLVLILSTSERWKVFISVCFALYLRNYRSYQKNFDNDIYSCFSLYFLKKCNIVNIKIISTVFLITICLSSSSINAKKKFWGVRHLLHMYVTFRELFFYRM